MRLRLAASAALAAILHSNVGAAAAAPVQSAHAQPAPSAPLTAQQWREDMRFMAAEMKRRHKNLFHQVTERAFDAAVADLDRRIPTLSRNQIIVGMMRIVAMVGDGHTRIDAHDDAKIAFRSLPLKLYLFDDGLYVRAASPKFANLAGAKVLKFDGVPAAEALKRVDPLIGKDNAMASRLFAPVYLNKPDILEALGLSPRRDAAELTLSKGGRKFTVTVPAGDVEAPWPGDTDGSFINPDGWTDARSGEQALWLKAPLDLHRVIALPARHAVYSQLNEVADVDGEFLPQYGRKIRELSNSGQADRVIIDLRLNFGGNMDLRNGYIREMIKTEDDDTRLFVLSGRGSFSATEAILVDLRRLTRAVFMGEPASSRPNSYGDGYRFELPNSGIGVIVSIRWNQLAGQSTKPWTGVDVAVPLTFADYAAGRDPVLEAALDYEKSPSLYDRLIAAAKAGGPQDAVKALVEYQRDPRNQYQDLGTDIPRTANWMFGADQHEAAFAVAQKAAELYPESADAWIVLAYLAKATDRREIALSALDRVIALDPNNRPARDLRRELTKGPAG